jgi:drug/metabolite transporter (DMT)-like permease
VSKIPIALYVLTTSSALVILKLGAKAGALVSFVDGKLHFNLNLYVLAGVLLYGMSFVLYTYLIASYDLGYIIPIAAAFVYVLIFLASFFIFKETFTLLKVGGIALIVVGLALLNTHK